MARDSSLNSYGVTGVLLENGTDGERGGKKGGSETKGTSQSLSLGGGGGPSVLGGSPKEASCGFGAQARPPTLL